MMALLSSSICLSAVSISFPSMSWPVSTPNPRTILVFISKKVPLNHRLYYLGNFKWRLSVSNIFEQEPIGVDLGFLSLTESLSDEELQAAVRLRIRTFYNFKQSCGIEDYQRYLTEREYQGLKERVTGNMIQFKRVSCLNATLPSSLLQKFTELCSSCKFFKDGKGCVVVGTMDVNRCHRLANELIGKKPEGIGADLNRGYLSNICVAKELRRIGLGRALVSQSKNIAHHWGITDLYVHVAADNEAAQRLYEKAGFIYENEEPAWQARFLGRPRRFLLWADLRQAN